MLCPAFSLDQVLGPLETLDPELAMSVLLDVHARIDSAYSDPGQAAGIYGLCHARARAVQKYRGPLLEALEKPWTLGDPVLALEVVLADVVWSKEDEEEQALLSKRPEAYYTLATMSPLGLLEAVVTSVTAHPLGDAGSFWAGVLAWQRLEEAFDAQAARKVYGFCRKRVGAVQRHRASLLAREPQLRRLPSEDLLRDLAPPQPEDLEEAALMRLLPRKYLELATMCPYALLDQVVTAAKTADPITWKPDQFWPDVLAAKGGATVSEKQKLITLLSVASECPKCQSTQTRHDWVKTRSADEPFKFLILCHSCKQSSVV